MGVWKQILATSAVSYVYLSIGLMFAWPSSTLNLFKNSETPLQRPMTPFEQGFLASVSSIGSMIMCPISGYLMEKIGRKYCALLIPLSHTIAWAMIALCNRVEVILTALFLSGAGGTIFFVLPTFIAEICQDSIRGTTTCGSMIFYNIGFLVSYFLGGYTEYIMMIYICLAMNFLAVITVLFLKESPTYLMNRGLEKEALEAIAFYRNEPIDSKLVLTEMETLRRGYNPDIGKELQILSPEEEQLKPAQKVENEVKKPLSVWEFVKNSKSTQKAIVLTSVMVTLGIFQGMLVLQVYAEPLFKEAAPGVSANLCSLGLGLLSAIFGLIASFLTDYLGRRPLMIYSSLLGTLCCVVLGTQLHLHWGPNWITILFIYLFCVVYSFGANTVPWVLVPEVFLPEIRSIMSMFVIEYAWLCNFIVLFLVNQFLSEDTLGPLFYGFAAVCFISTIYCVLFQPETRAMPADAIQIALLKKRSKWF